MKKSIIALSAIAALSTSAFAANVSNAEMMQQIEALKAQISALESKVGDTASTTKANKVSLEKMMNTDASMTSDARFKKLEKKVDVIGKTAQSAKLQSAGDNIKWDIDFRTQVDNITYKRTGMKDAKNSGLLTNRLWLGAAYAPNDNTVFHGKLSYNKAWGDTANHSQSNSAMGVGYADFDWVTNENAVDNEVKVKEAYWLYKQDKLFGTDVPWTVSVGRRPSTDGLPINLRNNQRANSPLSHVVDVEFDGYSLKLDTEKVTGLTGSWLKVCGGRGLTNAQARFSTMYATDYSTDETLNANVDMLGLIVAPYDDGQYSVHMNYAHAWNLIGYDNVDMAQIMGGTPENATFNDVGDIDFFTLLLKTEGIGDGISDYLDDTTVFASWAMSKTSPSTNQFMLGSPDSETGNSFWVGVNAPCPISPDDSRIGVEWNKGSKYWRSMTYGEDTYAGSKIAARGTAWEIYRNQKINNALSWGLSYTQIDYDYTGSNSFFGMEGTPQDVDTVTGAVTSARDIKAYVRYKF